MMKPATRATLADAQAVLRAKQVADALHRPNLPLQSKASSGDNRGRQWAARVLNPDHPD
jgi:hypothetical protein